MVDIPDNTATTAVIEGDATGGSFSGEIETIGDADWIRVTLAAGTTYRFYAHGVGPTDDDSTIALLQANGTVLAQDDDSGANLDSYLQYTATAGGVYYIEARLYQGEPGQYSVFVTTLDDPNTDLSANPDTYTGVAGETILGGNGSDTITLGAARTAQGDQGDDTIYGAAADDLISGGLGNDQLYGGGGADRIFGDAGVDKLDGGDGNDQLFGGADADRLSGRDGDDRLDGGDGADYLYGNLGNDVLRGGAGTDRLDGVDGTDTALYSENAVAVVVKLDVGDGSGKGSGAGGTAQGDVLISIENVYGGAGNDALQGSGVANGLVGNAGNDVLIGMGGADTLVGGAGADRFVYGGAGQSLVGAGADRITDFSHAQGDRIDLVSIDASTALAGNQAFAFIGAAAFTGVAGQLRAVSGATTVVLGDVNGDHVADFQINLTGAVALVAGDFVL
jgi:Ca2+-binding RTX toxin-like protein